MRVQRAVGPPGALVPRASWRPPCTTRPMARTRVTAGVSARTSFTSSSPWCRRGPPASACNGAAQSRIQQRGKPAAVHRAHGLRWRRPGVPWNTGGVRGSPPPAGSRSSARSRPTAARRSSRLASAADRRVRPLRAATRPLRPASQRRRMSASASSHRCKVSALPPLDGTGWGFMTVLTGLIAYASIVRYPPAAGMGPAPKTRPSTRPRLRTPRTGSAARAAGRRRLCRHHPASPVHGAVRRRHQHRHRPGTGRRSPAFAFWPAVVGLTQPLVGIVADRWGRAACDRRRRAAGRTGHGADPAMRWHLGPHVGDRRVGCRRRRAGRDRRC